MNLYQKSVKNTQKSVTSVSYISLNLIFYIPSLPDVDRFLILSTSPKIDFIEKASEANIFAKRRQIIRDSARFDIKILHSSAIFQND